MKQVVELSQPSLVIKEPGITYVGKRMCMKSSEPQTPAMVENPTVYK